MNFLDFDINDVGNEDDIWHGMPSFNQEKLHTFKVCKIKTKCNNDIIIRFDDAESFDELRKDNIFIDNSFIFETREHAAIATKQKITEKTKSIWYPFKSHWGREGLQKKWITKEKMNPRYPVYVVSKGRYENGLTTNALSLMGVEHYIVVEKSEFDKYNKNKNKKSTVLILPEKYLNEYDTCDEFGDSKSKGPGAARNFCIDHSLENGFKRHWVMDDNLESFYRLTDNEKLKVESGVALLATEDFIDRFSNVPVAGLNYEKFCKRTDKLPAYVLNTRIYSCLLIENKSGYRWRGRYNEDTDLSLRVLKDGLCTIQMNAFLCGKVTTQRMRGGNSKEFYDEEGTLNKSQMIVDLHPDVSKVVWKFNRWHHHVDYKPYKNNKLIKKDYKIREYGLLLVDR